MSEKVKKPFYKKWWLWALAIVVLIGIGTNTSEDETVANEKNGEKGLTLTEWENRLDDAIKQLGHEIINREVNEDGRKVIALSENIMFFVDVNGDDVEKVSLAALPDALILENDVLSDAFLLLVGTVDESLNAGQRSKVVSEMGLNEVNLLDYTKTYKHNGIDYIFKGTEENIVFQAEL